MPRPAFLELKAATIAEWRGHPVSSAMVDWIAWEADRCNYECAALLRKGRDAEARSVAGKAEALEEILAIVHRQDAPEEPKEEPFIDPVFRFEQQQEGANAGTE